jgi:hypothetical protein
MGEQRVQRRRDKTPEDLLADRQVTKHQLRVLQIMRDRKVSIFHDADICVLMVEPHRNLKHNCVAALRALRFIRPHDIDKSLLVLTWRGKAALELKGL